MSGELNEIEVFEAQQFAKALNRLDEKTQAVIEN
jgi:hypothetical protein